MAARFIQLLCISCNICLIVQMCSLHGVGCDVPDGVVYTDQHQHVRIGDSVALTCQFRGTPLAVYWQKLDDPTKVTTLVSWLKGDPVTGLCIAERPCEIMEMNEDYSLVIKKVSIAEQGRYICRVANYKGILIQNFTEISVFSPPKKPYPFINKCLMSPAMNSKQTCVISTAEDPINISCTASGYFSDLDLYFLCGSQYIPTIHSEEITNVDGKKNKSITIQASPCPGKYFCVASDIPGVGGQRVASLLVTTASSPVNQADSTLEDKLVAPPIVIIVSFAVIIIAIIHLHRCIRQQATLRNQEMFRMGTVESPEENHDEDDEITPIYRGSGEVQLKGKTSPNNQTIRLPLAVEEAGKTVGGRNRPVYNQVAKTFFKTRDEFNNDLAYGVLEEFALNVSDRQGHRLWNTLEHPENAASNEDEVSVTNARMLYPSLDNNKSRRRLRHTSERYNRHDLVDVLLVAFEGDKQCWLNSVSNSNVFVPRDQKNISSLRGPDLLEFEGHEQCLQKSVSNDSYSRVGSPTHYGSQASGMSTQPTSEQIQILISRGDRKTLTMMVRRTDTVRDLKVTIRERLMIDPSQYWLQSQGKILSDMSTLQSYGLQDSSTVHLHSRLRGGFSFSHSLA